MSEDLVTYYRRSAASTSHWVLRWQVIRNKTAPNPLLATRRTTR